MGDFWKYAEAEKRFHEVVNQALINAPQRIVCDDGSLVVVMSDAHHDRLTDALRRLIAMGGTPPDPVLLPLALLLEEERVAAAVAGREAGEADEEEDVDERLHRFLEEERELQYQAMWLVEVLRGSRAG
jgi:hypothetical protein